MKKVKYVNTPNTLNTGHFKISEAKKSNTEYVKYVKYVFSPICHTTSLWCPFKEAAHFRDPPPFHSYCSPSPPLLQLGHPSCDNCCTWTGGQSWLPYVTHTAFPLKNTRGALWIGGRMQSGNPPLHLTPAPAQLTFCTCHHLHLKSKSSIVLQSGFQLTRNVYGSGETFDEISQVRLSWEIFIRSTLVTWSTVHIATFPPSAHLHLTTLSILVRVQMYQLRSRHLSYSY